MLVSETRRGFASNGFLFSSCSSTALISIALTCIVRPQSAQVFQQVSAANQNSESASSSAQCGRVPMFLSPSWESRIASSFAGGADTNPTNDEPHRVGGKARIAGGFETEEGQFPSFVSLQIHRNADIDALHYCSGVLISNQHVLTAAHCLKLPNVNSYAVLVGPSNFHPTQWEEEKLDIYCSDRQCVSPLYDREPRAVWDYAIVKLSSPIELSDSIQPACLPKKPFDYSTIAYAVGTGYLEIRNGTGEKPNRAQALPVEQMACSAQNKHPTRICFKSSSKKHVGDVCKGDSGGPYLARIGSQDHVVAITSYGDPACMAGVSNEQVGADTYYARDHIRKLMDECSR